MSLTPQERRDWAKDVVSHILGITITFGFFSIIFAALMGYVDIKDPAVTAFVGTALGYAAAKIDSVIAYYYGVTPIGEARPNENDENR